MFKPIRDVVIVKKSNAGEAQSKGGIIIPGTSDSKGMSEGVVVAVGSGILSESGTIVPLEVNVGDIVLYGKTGCIDITEGGETFVMMREENVLGKR